MSDLSPIDYATPVSDRRRLGPAIKVTVWIIFDCIAIAMFAGLATHFEHVMMDFKSTPPLMSRLVFGLNEFYGTWLGSLLLWTVAAAGIAAVWVVRPQLETMTARNVFRFLIFLNVFILVLMAIFSIFVPYISLIQSVSNSNGTH